MKLEIKELKELKLGLEAQNEELAARLAQGEGSPGSTAEPELASQVS